MVHLLYFAWVREMVGTDSETITLPTELTTVAALPGIVLFWWMMRAGLIDAAMGTAGEVGEGDARA